MLFVNIWLSSALFTFTITLPPCFFFRHLAISVLVLSRGTIFIIITFFLIPQSCYYGTTLIINLLAATSLAAPLRCYHCFDGGVFNWNYCTIFIQMKRRDARTNILVFSITTTLYSKCYIYKSKTWKKNVLKKKRERVCIIITSTL